MQQRQVSPIPPGRYWITVTGPAGIEDFDRWLDEQRGSVLVESSSFTSDDESTLFVIFRVPEGRAPFLSAATFGFPSFAPPNVTSIQDVEQAPIVETPTLKDFGEGFGSFMRGAGEGLGLAGIGTIAILVLALAMFSEAPRRRRLTRRAA